MKTEENDKLIEGLKGELLTHCQKKADEERNKMILRLLFLTLGIGLGVIIVSLILTGKIHDLISVFLAFILMFFGFLSFVPASSKKAEALMEAEEKNFLQISLEKCGEEILGLKEKEIRLIERKEVITKLLEEGKSLV